MFLHLIRRSAGRGNKSSPNAGGTAHCRPILLRKIAAAGKITVGVADPARRGAGFVTPPSASRMDIDQKIEEISRERGRFHEHAYEFVREALDFTVGRMEQPGHITGQELLFGIRDLGREKFGRLAGLVFGQWGVKSTRDFGEIVFHLVDGGILSKRETDSIADFENVFDLPAAFDIDIECN
ncbi:MAG TPA: Minf_1886 family protein [Planctomycetota bacterium]|nr:Minf_1886 family protein [Planctomycetota bacterium]